jgi:hypothetical protein
MTPNNASSQRKTAAGPRRRRPPDSSFVRSILRPKVPIAPASPGLGARNRTLRHACHARSANQALARLHQTGPLCRPRPSPTIKSP